MGTERDEARVVATLNRDLSPRVVKVARSLQMNPNAFINAGVHALLEAAEGGDAQAPARFVELCQRGAGFTETPVTKALTQFVLKFYPELEELEESYRIRLITRVSHFVELHGKVPEKSELKKIKDEVTEGSLALARELKERRQAARRQARQANG